MVGTRAGWHTGYVRGVLTKCRTGPGAAANRDDVKVSRIRPGHLHIAPDGDHQDQGGLGQLSFR